MASVWSRAIGYVRRHGARRAIALLRKKMTGKVPWNIRAPATTSVRYLSDHQAALRNGNRAKQSAPSRAAQLFAVPTIAIIGDLGLPQCKKFRVMQKLEALHDMGFAARHSDWRDVPRCVDLLQTATHVFFYRMAHSDLLQAYLGEARRLGLATSYDIDDPLFDRAVYGRNRNLEFLAAAERRHLLSQCDGYLAAMRGVDNIIVSTPGLAKLAEEKTGKPTHVWRNAIDAETLHAAKLAAANRRKNEGGLVIGYGSGSRAHGADFAQAEDAILSFLLSHPQSRLVIAGHHAASARFAALGPRLSIVPFTDYTSYAATVAGFDINVVPLVEDGFNACKSAIRFLDAAVMGVPTIASKTGDFVNLIHDGETGLLADGASDWPARLRRLCGDAELRRRMGDAARRFVLTEMTALKAAQAVEPALFAPSGRLERAA